jgi:hypothetical protein
MAERLLEGRKLDQTIESLRNHIQWKINRLPQLAQERHFSPESIEALRRGSQEELDYLETVPGNITLGELMENYVRGEARTEDLVADE